MSPAWLATTLLLAGGSGDAAVTLSVRLVKTTAGRCTAPPRLELPAGWRVIDQEWHNGENDWEVYWEIETTATPPAFGQVVAVAPGLAIQRVIVGRTDVTFSAEGDRTTFPLVDDRARGRMMLVNYRSPRGGLPVELIHNWPMRRSWQYLADPYPAGQVVAVKNWLLGAQEVLRRMGPYGERDEKPWRGAVVLMDHEIAATRAHGDWPAHVHLMHYQFEPNAAGGRDWVSRLVPHFYLTDDGRIDRNNYGVLAGRGQSGILREGDVCHFEDTTGQPILDLTIREGGLDLVKPDGDLWRLRPDPELGATRAVLGYHGDQLLFRVGATDDPARGVFRYTLDLLDQTPPAVFEDGYRYDPFTAKVLGPL